VYLAFVLDVCSRRIVGWQLATHMRTGLVLDALRMALGTRRPGADFAGLPHRPRLARRIQVVVATPRREEL
jgi:putative transposase